MAAAASALDTGIDVVPTVAGNPSIDVAATGTVIASPHGGSAAIGAATVSGTEGFDTTVAAWTAWRSGGTVMTLPATMAAGHTQSMALPAALATTDFIATVAAMSPASTAALPDHSNPPIAVR